MSKPFRLVKYVVGVCTGKLWYCREILPAFLMSCLISASLLKNTMIDREMKGANRHFPTCIGKSMYSMGVCMFLFQFTSINYWFSESAKAPCFGDMKPIISRSSKFPDANWWLKNPTVWRSACRKERTMIVSFSVTHICLPFILGKFPPIGELQIYIIGIVLRKRLWPIRIRNESKLDRKIWSGTFLTQCSASWTIGNFDRGW